ncbi:atrial natriuretic peptide receptor 1-like isoform X1 [Centruroides sculpturatus]|uniref:atrial natriuretic peptide receptor 1-like isoform X1 n=2 Tax=Centruroides sculpturatus TaxID=218467 RepID=UPI000C6DD211|nr:atrial natriuretic peptide receptor 1-like isoform X1 [Centruroides sculpturatus]
MVGRTLLLLTTLVTLINAKVYNVGVLMMTDSFRYRFDIQHIGPAIDIAAEECKNEFDVNLNLVPGYYKHRCSQTESIGKATDMDKMYNITAFIGPACSDDLQIVGRFASYRKIPILTGLGDILSKRNEFKTLIRVSYELDDKARAILEFLTHFKWMKFGLIYRKGDVYYDSLKTQIKGFAEKYKMKVTCEEAYERTQNRTVLTDLKGLMIKIKICSRVVVILGGDREVRQMLLIAQELGMTESGEYAFICPELIQSEAYGNVSWAGGNEDYQTKLKIKKAYEALMIVSLNQPLSQQYSDFSNEVKRRALEYYNYTYDEKDVNYFTSSFHDAVWLLCQAINRSESHRNDSQALVPETLISIIKKLAKGIHGMSGNITINDEGDRIADYALLDQTNTKTGDFKVVLQFYGSTKEYYEEAQIHWPGGKPPIDRPECGFDGKDPKCLVKKFSYSEIIMAAVVVFLVIFIIVGIIIYRKLKLEAALANMSWRIRWEELTFTKNCRSSWMMSRLSLTSAMSSKMERGWVCWVPKVNDNTYLETYGQACELPQQYVLTAVYKGNTVAVKRSSRQKRMELTRCVLMELKIMREAQHQNIARFIGACVDPPNMAILTEYCPKGSLQDVLYNESLDLDWMFRYSLINDIVKGMCYLHGGEIGSHGRLRSSNCLVDSHFVLKLTDFGLPSFRHDETYIAIEIGDQKKYLWKAPELLRLNHCPPEGTQKGDVYSFGIILQEIVLREEPFYPHIENMDISDIIALVRSSDDPPFRPIISKGTCIKELQDLMQNCWADDPDNRPDFGQIKQDMRIINRGQNGEVNIMDNLLSRMEQYAGNLEHLVEQRTAAFLEEKRKSEELLYQVLPKSVAEQLKQGKAVEPEMFDSVTIYFSDIVGFTSMCSVSTPMQVVDFLNDLYTCFDSIVSDFDVYKVETIGDAYMVVSGLPDRNGINHAYEISRLALTLLHAMENFHIRHRPEEKLMLRIGIHTGSCCAGVVGQKMPRYCLFGDTVNTASRMESTGEPLKIHISSSTKHLLDRFGSFIVVPRGEIDVKGKGKMETYWLLREGEPEDFFHRAQTKYGW